MTAPIPVSSAAPAPPVTPSASVGTTAVGATATAPPAGSITPVLPVAGVEVITPTAQAPVAGSPWTATPLRDAPAPAPAEQGIALDAETEAALVDALTSARQRLVALCLCVALFGVSLIVALSVGASSPDADAAAGTTTVGNHAVEGGGR